ncbi:MAG TPA: hypothetical protein VF211_03845 [Burkholderiales bacterium]
MPVLALLALALSVPAYADGYWVDRSGKILKTAKAGFCIRTGKWDAKKADRACMEAAKKGSSMAMKK